MRLVSDALYKKLFSNIEGDPTSHLADEKTEILNDKTIPDEMKPLLYHQAVRNVNQKLKQESVKPLPVSHEAFDHQLRMNNQDEFKRQSLDRWLQDNNIHQSSTSHISIQNRNITGKLDNVKRWLLGERKHVKKKPAGVHLVETMLTNAGISTNYFEIKQSGSGSKKRKKPYGRGIKKNKQQKTNIQWKKY